MKESGIEFLLHKRTVMNREVVHHHDSFLEGVYGLQLLDERKKRVDCIASYENLSKYKSVLDTQGTYH